MAINDEHIKMELLQEIIKLAYQANQKGPKGVWVYFSGHVNGLGVRIANFNGSFIDSDMDEMVYLADEYRTDAEIISQLTAIREKLYEKVEA